MGLFENNRDEDSYQSRWQQEGSTVINKSNVQQGNGIYYTVTSGKVLYVTDIVLINIQTPISQFYLHDAIGGDLKLSASLPAWHGSSQILSFRTPLEFKEYIYFEAGSSNIQMTVSGWEESV